MGRGGVEPPTFHFSGGRSYQLSYLAGPGGLYPTPRPAPEPVAGGPGERRTLPDRDCDPGAMATPTGLEPAASAVTGRRANQLRYGARCAAIFSCFRSAVSAVLLRQIGAKVSAPSPPNGIRTRATAVKGRGPGPLDDGDRAFDRSLTPASRRSDPSRTRESIRVEVPELQNGSPADD